MWVRIAREVYFYILFTLLINDYTMVKKQQKGTENKYILVKHLTMDIMPNNFFLSCEIINFN